jgi:hypothetical protein
METWQIEVLRAVLGAGGWLMAVVMLLSQRQRGASPDEADQDVAVTVGRDINVNVFGSPTTGGTGVEATWERSAPGNVVQWIPRESESANTSQPVHPVELPRGRQRCRYHSDPKQLRLTGL